MPNLHMSIECAEPVNLLIIITIQDTKFVIFLISGYGPGCDIKTPVNSAKHNLRCLRRRLLRQRITVVYHEETGGFAQSHH